MSYLGRLARVAGVGLLDLMRGSEKKRQFLEDHREVRFYNRIILDLGVARDNVEFPIYGDIISLERTTGTLDIRFNEIEADHIELNRARKVITEFWRFYITNPAQAGLEAVLLVGRDALFDVETVKAIALIDTLGGDINPATEDKQDDIITEVSIPTGIGSGQKTVAAAGTDECLVAASTPCKGVVIKALSTNTDMVFVGAETVDSADGFILAKNEAVPFDIDNLNEVWLDVAVNGEGVSYLYVT